VVRGEKERPLFTFFLFICFRTKTRFLSSLCRQIKINSFLVSLNRRGKKHNREEGEKEEDKEEDKEEERYR
jgi:hypothetical protein